MEHDYAKKILLKYQSGNCTEAEKAMVNSWLLNDAGTVFDLTDAELLDDLLEIRARLRIDRRPRVIPLWARVAAAASLFVCLSLSIYLYRQAHRATATRTLQASSIKAGDNHAILRLANGAEIPLNGKEAGLIARQPGANVFSSGGGLSYIKNAGPVPLAKSYNILRTPTGTIASVELPDGSRVWLNASSTLKFPVSFTGKQRLVELTGEAYFEVVHNSKMPFKVKAAGQVVQDMGTHFNLNAYSDEPGTRTTLLQGKVSITMAVGSQSAVLVPGQQAFLAHGVFTTTSVNAAEAVAWKEGLFEFNHTNLRDLMRQVSRWYNLKIVYEGDVKDDQFFGEVDRKYNLAEVLKVLQLSGLHFRVEAGANTKQQNQLIVTP